MTDGGELEGKSRDELLAMVAEQRAALSTYKDTLGRIYQEFDAKIAELSLIRRVADALRQSETLGQLAMGLIEVVMDELPADAAVMLLTDPEMTKLTPLVTHRAHWDAPRLAPEGPGMDLPLTEGELGRAVSAGRILTMEDLAGEPLAPWPAALPDTARSLLSLPLVARQQILGAMLMCSEAPESFGQEHARILTIICDHAASALSNVRLIEQLGEINERLLASELEAHQAKEYLQRLLDTASDVIFIAGAGGEVSYANQAAAELGLTPDELSGRPLASLFADCQRAAAVLADPQSRQEELELLAPQGPRLMLASTTPLPESGEVLAILRDITHRRVLERQLMHAEKLASVGILAAGVAHEIGNPLSAVSGYAQLLEKDDISPEERREFAGAIASQAERINKIIRDLLEYSRPSPYQGQATRANQAIEAVLGMFFTQKRLRSYNLSINRDLARGLPPVLIDRDQLQQVVLNMVMNAAQAMEQGGALTITTAARDGFLRIDFADTGPGIPPENLGRIFDPFFTTKPVGQGTGLGLSICDRIISQAGGRIEVASRPGKGTAFTVVLPAAEPGAGDAGDLVVE